MPQEMVEVGTRAVVVLVGSKLLNSSVGVVVDVKRVPAEA